MWWITIVRNGLFYLLDMGILKYGNEWQNKNPNNFSILLIDWRIHRDVDLSEKFKEDPGVLCTTFYAAELSLMNDVGRNQGKGYTLNFSVPLVCAENKLYVKQNLAYLLWAWTQIGTYFLHLEWRRLGIIRLHLPRFTSDRLPIQSSVGGYACWCRCAR